MFVINKSRWPKIILLLLIFTIFEKGWVVKIRPAVEMGAILVTQEALSAVALAASFLWRAYTNSHDSAVDHLFGQEIDRLANHKGVSGAHSTISANTPQQLSHISVQHEKPASTIKSVATVQYASSVQKKPGQTISNTSTNACNVPDKSCAVVSSVAHEQVAQMTQTTIDESQKIAAQKLLNNVAADWHIQMDRRSGELMRSVCAHEYNQSQVYEQKWGKEYTCETHLNGGTTYRAPNQKFSLSVCPATQHRPHSVADDIAQQRLEEQIQIVFDPYLRAEILQELTAFINNARNLIYGALHERVAALLNLVDFHIRWSAYGQPLEYVQRGIYAQYASKDGSICIARLFDMTDAHKIFKKYIASQKKVATRFSEPCQKVRQSSTSYQFKKNSQLIKKRNKVDFRAIRNNRINQCYKQMLEAFACGDMEQVEQIKNNNAELQDLTILYNSLKAEYDKIILHQESLLKDEYGIVHYNLPAERRDPVYTVLSKRSRAQLKCNPSALASFNDTLKLRQLNKNALHKAWDIPKTAIPAVHQALYALIDIDTIPERINKIHELSINNKISVPEQQSLVEALFLPNGIIRDFAEYDRAKRLSMPRAILRPEHATTRTLLNQLVYAERTCNDGQIESECAAAIECIQKSFTTDNQESSVQYKAKALVLYDRIINSCGIIAQELDDEISHDNVGCLNSPKEEPYCDEAIRGTCGTGQIKEKPLSTGSCLPKLHNNSELSLCPEQKNSIEQGGSGTQINVPDIKQQPCGYQGQTLPGLESDNAPVGESKDSENESEDTESSTGESEDIESDEGESGQVGISSDSAEIEAENDASYGVAVLESSEVETTADNVAANKTIKTVQDLKDESRSRTPTTGFSTQYDRSGGYAEAVKDFESLHPNKVRNLPNNKVGKHGILSDGRDVIVRLDSSGDDYPTLEIQHKPDRKKIKFRYMGERY